MKGLLLKDLYGMGVYKNALGLMLLLVAGMSIMNRGNFSFVSSMLTMYIVLVSITLFSLDETANWDRYAATAPLPRRSMVTARYLFLFVLILSGALISFAIGTALSIGFGQTGRLEELASSAALMAGLGFIVCALFAPLAYKFGANKSRFALMAVALLPMLAVTFVMPRLQPLLATLEANSRLVMLLAAAACLLLYLVSYFISARIYARKEF